MADINLERKKGGSIWPWIIGLLVLLLLIWVIVEAMDRDDPDVVATGTATETVAPLPPATTGTDATTAGSPAQVEEYMRTCHVAEGATTPQTVGREHEFSTNCLDLLASSMSAVAAQRPANPEIDQQLNTVREQIQSIRQSDPTSLEHSNSTREAAMASADALSSMRQAFAGTNQQAQSAADAARNAAQEIQGSEALLNQQDALMRFFREAGNALQAMASGTRV